MIICFYVPWRTPRTAIDRRTSTKLKKGKEDPQRKEDPFERDTDVGLFGCKFIQNYSINAIIQIIAFNSQWLFRN